MPDTTIINSAGCDFCKIARGEDASARIICGDHSWVAFFPLNPAVPGHTLIIPRTHVSNLWEVDASEAAALINAVIKVGKAIKEALTPDGMNLITSDGEAAEQTVFHLHMHLVPRWHKDGFGPIWSQDKHYGTEGLDSTAERIRRFCDREA